MRSQEEFAGWAATLWMLSGLDWLTTYMLIEHKGATEVNPILGNWVTGPFGMVLKLGVVGGILGYLVVSDKRLWQRARIQRIIKIAWAIYAAVVGWNVAQLVMVAL